MLSSAAWTAMRMAIGLLAISALAFLAIAAMPSDPVMIAIRAWNLPATPETIGALRASWGLDQPLWHRYSGWLIRFVCGDWGVSFRTGEPILQEFLHRLPLSFGLGLGGLALAALLAVPLGFAAALRPGGIADFASRLVSIGSQAIPSFWLGLLLLWILGVQFRLIRPFSGDTASYVLPVVLIAFNALGGFVRVYRRDLLEQTQTPYYRTALSKGLSRRQALWRHGHQGAIYALLAAIRAEAGWAIGSTAALELLFGLPGISQFLVQSIGARDYQVLQAYVMVVACWMIVMNASLAFASRRLDPRIA